MPVRVRLKHAVKVRVKDAVSEERQDAGGEEGAGGASKHLSGEHHPTLQPAA